jgi:hypothetical protein
MRLTWPVLAGGVCLLTLFGCSDSRRSSTPSALETALGGEALRDPSKILEIENSVSTCMKREGFTYHPQPAPKKSVRTLEQVREEGFGISLAVRRTPSPPDRNSLYFSTLTPAQANQYIRTLSGPRDAKSLEDAGCRGAAEARYLPKPAVAVQINLLLDSMDKAMHADRKYLRAASVYPSCMVLAGFPNKDGATLRSEFAEAVDKGVPARSLQVAERTAAVADFTCQKKQDDRLRSVRAAYESDFLRRNSAFIERAMAGRLGR